MPGRHGRYPPELRERAGTSARGERDEALKTQIAQVHQANCGVYGARKVWLALNREGIPVARCTALEMRSTAPTPLAGKPAGPATRARPGRRRTGAASEAEGQPFRVPTRPMIAHCGEIGDLVHS